MPKFSYIARDKSGKRVSGIEAAGDQDELVARLQAKNMVVINLSPASKASARKSQSLAPMAKHSHHRITSNDLTVFCRQLATLLGAGVTILEALTIISREVASRQLLKVINNLKKDMEKGLSLHQAMANYRHAFSVMWINLVESGEASGNLAIILSRLATYLERDAQFRTKIITSLMYPTVLLVVGVCALLFLTLKIIPTFAQLLSNFNLKLPLVTQILIGTSSFLRHYLIFFVIAFAVAGSLFKRYIRTPEGRKNFERFLFKVPIFGDFFRNLIIERFSSEMSTLIEGGIPILYALEISERSVDNLIMAEIIRDIKEEVRAGRSLSVPMEKSGFFGPMVTQMVHVGEEVGDLSGMFKRINAFYQEYVETFLVRITSMFEPVMIVFIGGIIGVMVVGMFLPMFQISQIGTQ